MSESPGSGTSAAEDRNTCEPRNSGIWALLAPPRGWVVPEMNARDEAPVQPAPAQADEPTEDSSSESCEVISENEAQRVVAAAGEDQQQQAVVAADVPQQPPLRYPGEFFAFKNGKSIHRDGCSILERPGAFRVTLCRGCVQELPPENVSLLYLRDGMVHARISCVGHYTCKNMLPCSKCDPFGYTRRHG